MVKRPSSWLLILITFIAACGSQNETQVAIPTVPRSTSPTAPANQEYPAQLSPTPYAPPYPVGTALPAMDPTLFAEMQATGMAIATTETARLLQPQAAEMSAMPTSLSAATVTPHIFPTRQVVESKPTCSPGEQYISCHDDILEIDFQYPAIWGEIAAYYAKGGYAGYSYEYSFARPNMSARAGGRSRDFSEGRGGMLTDFTGFGTGAMGLESTCRYYAADICTSVQPAVVMMIRLPNTEQGCNPDSQLGFDNVGIVAINLPEGPKINGFLFASDVLSVESWNELYAILGSDAKIQQEKCQDAALRQQFDAKVNEIRRAIEAGTVDSGTQEKVDHLLHIAESIQFD